MSPELPMGNLSIREKILYWWIKNANKWWLLLPVVLISCALINIPVAGVGGLGLALWGALCYGCGVDYTLRTRLGKNYTIYHMIYLPNKEKTNDKD